MPPESRRGRDDLLLRAACQPVAEGVGVLVEHRVLIGTSRFHDRLPFVARRRSRARPAALVPSAACGHEKHGDGQGETSHGSSTSLSRVASPQGLPMRALQELMGHADFATTLRYAVAALERLQALKGAGALSVTEFELAKQKVLGAASGNFDSQSPTPAAQEDTTVAQSVASPPVETAGTECWAAGCAAPIAPGEMHYCEVHRRSPSGGS